MLRKLYYSLSPSGRRLARKLYYLPYDTFRTLFKKQDRLIPPKGKANVGRGDFKSFGDKFCKDIINTCKVTQNNKILDVGCGIGRIARPFAKFLSSDGYYCGFDILKSDIEWCKKQYADYKNFNFNSFPIINDLYLSQAQCEAKDFNFPFKEKSFDLVILISVFTHMQAAAVKNYFYQISKVLKSGGKIYGSFFLTESDKSYSLFPYSHDKFCLHNTKVKNANVAYDKEYIYNIAKSFELEVMSERMGWWNNGNIDGCFDFQDIVIFKKI